VDDSVVAHHLADDEVDFRVDEGEVDEVEVVGNFLFYKIKTKMKKV
jgi:hypothetical protein